MLPTSSRYSVTPSPRVLLRRRGTIARDPI
jgi:hypothetical protein